MRNKKIDGNWRENKIGLHRYIGAHIMYSETIKAQCVVYVVVQPGVVMPGKSDAY